MPTIVRNWELGMLLVLVDYDSELRLILFWEVRMGADSQFLGMNLGVLTVVGVRDGVGKKEKFQNEKKKSKALTAHCL